jgi:putative acetyltransferase
VREAILVVHRSAARGTTSSYYPSEVINAWGPMEIQKRRIEALAHAIESGDEIVVVVEDADGRIAGFGSIVPKDSELRTVYVRPDRGRRGVGRQILDRLVELARGAGLTKLRMDASINAEAFYAANGFLSGKRAEHVFQAEIRMDSVLMRKLL